MAFTSTQMDKPITQQSLARSILYHSLPGICILLFYLLVTPWLINKGFQPTFGVLMGFVFVGIPLQLFIMFREGYKIHGRYTLAGVIHYTNRIPIWQYLVLILVFIGYAFLITFLMNPLNSWMLDHLFTWLPEWFRNSAPPLGPEAPVYLVTLTFGAMLLVDGIINPIVEELYFRGYLMPRLSRYGWWAPVISALLFSLVHFWQPWNALMIFVLVLPIYLLVLYKKNIFISMVLHCAANLIGALLSIGLYLSQ